MQTAWWGANPIGLFDRCAERFGDTFTIKLGYRGRVVCVSSPTAIKEVFLGAPSVYHAGEAYEVLGPVAGDRSPLLLDEDEHLRLRRLLLPPLHGGALESWASMIAEVTEETIASWPRDRPFSLRDSTERITLEVIMRIVFGISDPRNSEELRALLPYMFQIGPLTGSAFLFPALRRDLGGWTPWARFMRRRRRIDELLYAEIAARRAELRVLKPKTEGTPQDVLTLLLSARDEEGKVLTDAELRDALVTMLLAGQETTATSLAWAFERLLRHPRELSTLTAEVRTDRTEYLDAVIKETLRIRPVVAQVGRVLTEAVEIDGWTVPAGQMVMGVISRVHRSPELYSNPLEFRPERFLEGEGEGYTWIPFGGGVRRCVGAGLALLEMRTVLATVLRNARLAPESRKSEGVRVRGVTLAPAKGCRVVLDQKPSSHPPKR